MIQWVNTVGQGGTVYIRKPHIYIRAGQYQIKGEGWSATYYGKKCRATDDHHLDIRIGRFLLRGRQRKNTFLLHLELN